MRALDFIRHALGICATAALMSCGGSQTTIGAPHAMSSISAITADVRGKSWMLPKAKSADLLYLSAPFYNNVYVFALPSGEVVGSIGGLNRPTGECTDGAGHIFITNTLDNDILEYSHGGTSPIATLADPEGTPYSCAVDGSTGNLAVGDFYNDVSIYPKEKSPAVSYSNYQMTYIYFLAYDGSGNLFVDGLYGNGSFRMAELPRAGTTFSTITLKKRVSPGAIQWDGTYLAVTNGGTNSIYRMRIVGSKGNVIRTATLRGGKCIVSLTSDWIQDGIVIAPFSRHCGMIGEWPYPAGGKTIDRFENVDEAFFGVTVSLAPK